MKSRSPSRSLIAQLLLLVVLGGCVKAEPTEVQTRLKSYDKSNLSATARFNVCMRNAQADAAFIALKAHFAVPASKPTHEQLSDQTLPTGEDVANLRTYFPVQEKCHNDFVKAVEPFFSEEADFYRNAAADINAVLINLIDRKITWGESARRKQKIATYYNEKGGELRDKLAADLVKQHREELRQRRMNPATYE